MLEGRHSTAQLICLAGGKAGADHGHLHGLLLEQGNTQCLAEHTLEFGGWELDRLLALPAAKIGVDHVTLNRTGPHDGDFDDEIVERPRLDPREHAHLRTTLDLEDPDRIRLADHGVGRRILGRDSGQVEGHSLVLGQQVEAALHAGEHPERQDVDLHEFQDIDIVLVPLDHLAIGHARRLDRRQIVEPVIGQNETAWMLRQMPRGPLELLREFKRQPQPAIGDVEIEFAGAGLVDTLAMPPDLRREQLGHVLGQAQSLADVADGALGVIAHHGRAQRAVVAAIGLVDPLHDDLAPLMLEVDIDVRGLVALLGDKALEQEIVALGIDAGDAQDVADGGIGGRASALAQDVLAARELHDGIHGQEIGRILQGFDQAELVLEQSHDLVGNAFRISSARTFPGELLECLLRRQPRQHLFFRILIGQLVEGKAALPRDLDGTRKGFGIAREETRHFPGWLEEAVGMALAPESQFVDGDVVADGRHHILQDAPAGFVK